MWVATPCAVGHVEKHSAADMKTDKDRYCQATSGIFTDLRFDPLLSGVWYTGTGVLKPSPPDTLVQVSSPDTLVRMSKPSPPPKTVCSMLQ